MPPALANHWLLAAHRKRHTLGQGSSFRRRQVPERRGLIPEGIQWSKSSHPEEGSWQHSTSTTTGFLKETISQSTCRVYEKSNGKFSDNFIHTKRYEALQLSNERLNGQWTMAGPHIKIEPSHQPVATRPGNEPIYYSNQPRKPVCSL